MQIPFYKITTCKYFNPIILFFLLIYCLSAHALPPGFVYLHDVNSSIQQDIRYAGSHNFVGRPLKGYAKPKCILTKEAAQALSLVQKELEQSSLSLKVYDCYRPTDAVLDFMRWSKDPHQQEMKKEFYPNVNKADVFALGYVAEKSGHSRGSTIDLTIIPIPFLPSVNYRPGQHLVNCIAPYLKRFRDSSIDMGTGYDCFDVLAHALNPSVSIVAHQNRLLLREIMMKYGFVPYDDEWWHFSLKNEPYPNTYFNFTVK